MASMTALSPSTFPSPAAPPPTPSWPARVPGSEELEALTPGELHRLLQGDVEADALEHLLAVVARARGALDLAVGDGLAALCVGERLIRLGHSCLGGYAREALAAEYLGAHPIAPLEEAAADGTTAMDRSRAALRERQEARLEAETQRWWLLAEPEPAPAPDERFEELGSARAIDRRLRELASLRDSWDDVLGHCARAVQASGLWRVLGFASFGHYCRERLGLSERAVEQRAALERRLWEVPALKAAHRAGLSRERLRLFSRLPDREVAAWVARAGTMTCVALRRAPDPLAARPGARSGPLPRAGLQPGRQPRPPRRAEGPGRERPAGEPGGALRLPPPPRRPRRPPAGAGRGAVRAPLGAGRRALGGAAQRVSVTTTGRFRANAGPRKTSPAASVTAPFPAGSSTRASPRRTFTPTAPFGPLQR
jgi:hypothetical protein